MSEKVCTQCEQSEIAIRKHNLFCATIDPQTGETDYEWDRHRFRPWTEKELKAMQMDEESLLKSMGEMAAMNGYPLENNN